MSLIDMPLWLQLALAAEGLGVVWLTVRFGRPGLVWSALGAVAFWFVFALAASWLVGRLEGGRATEVAGLVSGAGLATLRLAQIGAPLIAIAAVVGLVLRRLSLRKRKAA